MFSATLLVIPPPGILLEYGLISSKFHREAKCLKIPSYYSWLQKLMAK